MSAAEGEVEGSEGGTNKRTREEARAPTTTTTTATATASASAGVPPSGGDADDGSLPPTKRPRGRPPGSGKLGLYSQLASYGSGGATSLPSNAIAIANAGASHLSSRGPTPPPGTSGAVNTTATGTGTARITNTNTSGSGGGAGGGGGGKQARLSKGTELATIDTIRALNPNLSPFTSMYDACDRLFPYHAMYEENFQQQHQQLPLPHGVKDRKGGKGEDLAFWSRWNIFIDEKVKYMGSRVELLEKRFQSYNEHIATEETLDAYQVELMQHKEAISDRNAKGSSEENNNNNNNLEGKKKNQNENEKEKGT